MGIRGGIAGPVRDVSRADKEGTGTDMLVLTRHKDETIMIGDDIEVTVVDIRGDKVRIGINAPKEVSVHRKEVYEAIRRENRAAAEVARERPPQAGGGVPPGTERQRPT